MKPNRIDRKRSVLQTGILLGALSVAPLAQAQAHFEPWVSGKPGEQHLQTRFGMSVQGGGGVTYFTGSNENNLTNAGGAWDVRVVFGTRMIPALEAAYVGNSRSVSSGIASGSTLVSNGAEGAFRLNAPILVGETLVEPFGFVGLGWAHYYLTSLNGPLVSVRSDDVGTIPMGGGLAIAYHGFLAEARFSYRPTWGETNMVLSDNGRTFDLDAWTVGGMIGFEF
jgi:hypothetical protein